MIKALLIALSLCLILGTGEAHSKEEPIMYEPETEKYEIEEKQGNAIEKNICVEMVDEEVLEIEPEVVIETKPAPRYFDVPLSEDLQDHIFALCEEHNIAPGIIIAMIESESNYKADAVGDSGNSVGLMQIQSRWNQERMDRLGCHNLFDPFQNVTVGIDLVAERKAQNADLMWVLMSFNGGIPYADEMFWNGKISDYALKVVERATELNLLRR